ncbi:MAG TPA: hypothetical protein ENI23_00680 [bacterium]|nr:hypothetical protein [bacterium]
MTITALSPPSLIGSQLVNQILAYDSSIVPQHDLTLGYVEVLKGQYAYRSQIDLNADTLFPLLAYNRSHVKPFVESMGPKRTISKPIYHVDAKTGTQYRAFAGQFEFQWKYFHNEMTPLELFEILYVTESSINTVTKFTITYPIIGDFQYDVQWGDLEELEISSRQDGFFFSLSGSAIIRGAFLTIDSVPANLINVINTFIQVNIDPLNPDSLLGAEPVRNTFPLIFSEDFSEDFG